MGSPVQEWRKRCHMTQAKLASELGLSPSTLSQKENGFLAWQQKDLLFLAEHYGLSADFVLGIDAGGGDASK